MFVLDTAPSGHVCLPADQPYNGGGELKQVAPGADRNPCSNQQHTTLRNYNMASITITFQWRGARLSRTNHRPHSSSSRSRGQDRREHGVVKTHTPLLVLQWTPGRSHLLNSMAWTRYITWSSRASTWSQQRLWSECAYCTTSPHSKADMTWG